METIRQLREELARERKAVPPFAFYGPLRLSRRERLMVSLLVDRDFMTREALWDAFREVADDRDILLKNVEVIKCRLNKKLAPLGARVRTLWGVGSYFTAADKAALALIEATPPVRRSAKRVNVPAV